MMQKLTFPEVMVNQVLMLFAVLLIQEKDFIQMKSRGKLRRRAPVTPDSNLLFVIRIRGLA